MALHNRISRKELKALALQDSTPRTTISFYQYTPIADPKVCRDNWYESLEQLKVFGRIYIAHEGVNAQISVPDHAMENFVSFLYNEPGFNSTRLNKAIDQNQKSFYVLDIKVRNKIVADGIEDPGFDMQNKGGYVNAEKFNELASDPSTILVDMRNHYEFEVGHFLNAIEVPSDTFRDQLPMAVDMLQEQKDQNIIMYCTGGIRCEKASAWMLHRGFKNVFHLEGGIINYVREANEKKLENRFVGKNFVFDERLGERITQDILAQCHTCGAPCDTHINCANSGCHLLFIQCDDCKEKLQGCCSKACAEIIALPEEIQKEQRRGIDKGRNVFNKSKQRIQGLKSGTGKDL